MNLRKNLRNTGATLGLVISLSLALGYLLGRFHAETALETQTSPKIQSVETASNRRSHPPEHDELIPDPVRSSPSSQVTPELNGKDARRAEEKYAPRQIGAFVDPDGTGPEPTSEPRHIGPFMDPDQPWVEAEDTERVDLGELIEPDELDQGP